MEDFIGFFIVVVSLIISVIASIRKQSRQNKASGQSLENTTDVSSEDQRSFENPRIQDAGSNAGSWEETLDYGEDEWEDTPEQNIEEVEKPQEETRKSAVQNEKSYAPQLKEPQKKKKKQSLRKNRIQEIKEKFDVEEAIIYSEIINRKHF